MEMVKRGLPFGGCMWEEAAADWTPRLDALSRFVENEGWIPMDQHSTGISGPALAC